MMQTGVNINFEKGNKVKYQKYVSYSSNKEMSEK